MAQSEQQLSADGALATMSDLLLLTSSNSTKTYFTNALAILCWPRGWVVHVRYQVRWLNDPLKALLTTDGSKLKGRRVLAAYLFQQRVDEHIWEPVEFYPLRFGTLVDAHRVGADDGGVAHFYFQLGDFYIPPAAGASGLDLQKRLGSGVHAGLVEFTGHDADSRDDESAARQRLQAINKSHVAYQPDKTKLEVNGEYYPLICHIRQLRTAGKQQKLMQPTYESESRTSTYQLTEGQGFIFDFGFYVPDWCAPPGKDSKVTLSYDEKAFATTPMRTLTVESRYDEQAWLVIPSPTSKSIRRDLVLQTDVRVAADMDPTNLTLTIPVNINPNVGRRSVAALSDSAGAVGLTVGTVGVALLASLPASAPKELLLVIAIAGYVVWLAITALSHFWTP